jgi:hypothetical protein
MTRSFVQSSLNGDFVGRARASVMPVLPKKEMLSLDGNLIIEGDNVRCAPEE